MGVMPAIDVHCASLLMNISATLVGGLQIDRASDSLRSLVERSLPSGAAGPGSTSPHPPSFSQFPLFSFTICTDGYCPLKTDCDFHSANSWHPPMPVLRESTASTDQRIKCQIRIFLSQLQLHLSLAEQVSASNQPSPTTQKLFCQPQNSCRNCQILSHWTKIKAHSAVLGFVMLGVFYVSGLSFLVWF